MEYLKIDKSKLKRYVDEDIYIYIYGIEREAGNWYIRACW
jgi:hypothetical protein